MSREMELRARERYAIARRRGGDGDDRRVEAVFQREPLWELLQFALIGFRFLLLPVLNRVAHRAGVLPVERPFRSRQEAILRRVIDEHIGPSNHLDHAPVAAAKMQAAKQCHEGVDEALHSREVWRDSADEVKSQIAIKGAGSLH